VDEDDLIPLSALQHYLFCPRQCALIHVEQIWVENVRTAAGRLLHERVDTAGVETRPGVRSERGVAIRSLALGVAGRADVVEWHGQLATPVPVEYKRGSPKPHRADEVQLCAQAICLEEMSGRPVPEGFLFYGETRRRTRVPFDPELRALTARVAAEARASIRSGNTPPPVRIPGFKSCSLQDACHPRRLERPPAVSRWLAAQWTD
jgi:CRISPR-associated exonuclease Cas4